jgi:hypothetical protein
MGDMRRVFAILATASTLLTTAACGANGDGKPAYVTVLPSATSLLPTTTTTPGATTTTSTRARTLLGVCPSPVVIQLDGPFDFWSAPYATLASTEGVSDGLRYRAPMVDPITRAPMGIDVELRTIGALPGGSGVAAAVLGDPSVLVGTVDFTTVLPTSDRRPVLVAAPWTRGDLALRWRLDSASSDARTVGDLAGTIIANPDLAPGAAGYLQASGLLPRKRDLSIVRPDVTGPGTTGEASLLHLLDDPTRLPQLVDGVGLDRAQLLAEVGWEPYPHALVTRPASVEERQDCLRAIIPLIQRAVLRTARQPVAVTEHLAGVVAKVGLALNREQVVLQLRATLKLGLLGIGTESGPIAADVTQGRVIQIAKAQVLSSRVIKPRLSLPSDLATLVGPLIDRRFLDSSLTYDVDDAELLTTGS